MRKAPLPARKKPFQRGNMMSETNDATAMSAIITHNTVRIVFFFDIVPIDLPTKIATIL